jgi:Na+/proline symporter
MIIEPITLLSGMMVIIIGAVVAILFFVLAGLCFGGVVPGKKIAGAASMIGGFLVIILMLTATFAHVPEGTLGIDQNGNWYKQGTHLFSPNITVVPLKGTIAFSQDQDLAYNLTQEEVISLASGSHFPEYLRNEIIVRYDKWNISIDNVPPGVNRHHLSLVINF